MKIVACEGKHSKSTPGQASQKTGTSISRLGFSGSGHHGDADSGNMDEDRSDEDVP